MNSLSDKWDNKKTKTAAMKMLLQKKHAHHELICGISIIWLEYFDSYLDASRISSGREYWARRPSTMVPQENPEFFINKNTKYSKI